MNVELQILPHGKDLPVPSYQTTGSSGMDLRAAIDSPLTVTPGEIVLVPTGMKISLPHGFEFQVRPRSGLALKHGIAVLNSPGTIDADYRGEIQIILANLGKEPFEIERGLRIAQMVLCRVESVSWDIVEQLDETHRGDGGFGHTGKQ